MNSLSVLLIGRTIGSFCGSLSPGDPLGVIEIVPPVLLLEMALPIESLD